MKHKARIIVLCSVLFIFLVSYKILQPEINAARNNPGGQDLDGAADSDPAGVRINADFRAEHRQGRNVKSNGERYWQEYNQTRQAIISRLLELYDIDWDGRLDGDPWEVAGSWVKARQITPVDTPQLGRHTLVTTTTPQLYLYNCKIS